MFGLLWLGVIVVVALVGLFAHKWIGIEASSGFAGVAAALTGLLFIWIVINLAIRAPIVFPPLPLQKVEAQNNG